VKQRVRVLVEGGDDAHFVHHFVNATLQREIKVDQCGSLEKLLAIAATHVSKESPVDLLVVICDADANPAQRWKEIRQSLTEAYVPESPVPNGLIADFSRQQKLAIWMMPNNGGPGAIEDFLAEIRVRNERQSVLAIHAKNSLAAIQANDRLFAAKDESKAELRTWLAWQKEPGAPFGLAVNLGCFDLEHASANRFAAWFRRALDSIRYQ